MWLGPGGVISEELINLKSFIIWDKFWIRMKGVSVKREEFLVMYKYIILFCAQQILFLKICRLFQLWICLVLSLASCLAWMGKETKQTLSVLIWEPSGLLCWTECPNHLPHSYGMFSRRLKCGVCIVSFGYCWHSVQLNSILKRNCVVREGRESSHPSDHETW